MPSCTPAPAIAHGPCTVHARTDAAFPHRPMDLALPSRATARATLLVDGPGRPAQGHAPRRRRLGRGHRRGHCPSVKATGAPTPGDVSGDGTRHEAQRSRSAGRQWHDGARISSHAKTPHLRARARTVFMHVRRRIDLSSGAPEVVGRDDAERDWTAVRMARHSSCSPPVGRGPRGGMPA